MIMNINNKYSNEEILKDIKDEHTKKWAEFLDSKGIIILEIKIEQGFFSPNETLIKFLSTKNNIVSLSVIPTSKNRFAKVNIKEYIELYIYLDENSIENIINEKYDGIIIGKYFKDIDISYDNYVKVSNILINNYSDMYNLLEIEVINNKLVVSIYKVESNMKPSENRKYLYLVFNEEYNDYIETTEKPKHSNTLKCINTDKLTDYNNPIVKLYTEREEK